jgi:hypothetical protein
LPAYLLKDRSDAIHRHVNGPDDKASLRLPVCLVSIQDTLAHFVVRDCKFIPLLPYIQPTTEMKNISRNLGATLRGGTRSYFHNEKPQILCAAVRNSVVQDLCTAGLLMTILCITFRECEIYRAAWCVLSTDFVLKVQDVKHSHYSPEQAQRLPAGLGSQISRQSTHEGGKVISPMHRPPLLRRKYSWYSFLLEAESTPEP